MYLIILLKIITFFLTTVPPYGRHIDHSTPELYECTPFNWDIQVRNVMKSEVNEFLKLVISKIRFQALQSEEHQAKFSCTSVLKQRALCGVGTYLRPDELAVLVRDQAVLGEDVVIVGDD